MQNHGIGRAIGQGQLVHVALAQFGGTQPGLGQLCTRQPQHLRAAVDAQRAVCLVPEKRDHPAGARADIDEAADPAPGQQRAHRRLHLGFGHIKAADRVPLLGMLVEIAFGGGRAVGAHRSKARRIGGLPVIDMPLLPDVERPQNGRHIGLVAQPQENPAAFLAPRGKTGIGKNLHMARNARLALPQHLCQLAHRQLHRAQQHENAQARRIGKGAKDFERGNHGR